MLYWCVVILLDKNKPGRRNSESAGDESGKHLDVKNMGQDGLMLYNITRFVWGGGGGNDIFWT